MTAYDPNNIFAKIIRGVLPCERVYEDQHTLAFMDIMPQGDGHLLVVPKSPARNMLDVDPAVLGPLMTTVQKLAKAVKSAFDADGVTVMQFNESAAGQTVFHIHVHVIPRWEGIALLGHSGAMADPELLKSQAEKIRKAIGFNGWTG
ncbi:HIT family protein [Chelatococcus asaccharovorans]|uniref:Histidine triad (HIT) family protein n=1 Tax=Chelatococcus asaccharovorans TaxID=28210 RepID=A0A2V3U7U1_9HYPH|nr:histidine triad (HIT) family protein [Chelatococcus asaccharovorans]CAH1666954.1 Histidine triad (HIT) family protein [Chelatococcus asaccharovorans]CAH1681237.1 Histidine triad (HIT) family protein [Chelatococcus asaccharovorans]